MGILLIKQQKPDYILVKPWAAGDIHLQLRWLLPLTQTLHFFSPGFGLTRSAMPALAV
jgi:hypothetical protein